MPSSVTGLVIARVRGFANTQPAMFTIHCKTGAGGANTAAGISGLASAIATWAGSSSGLKSIMAVTTSYLRDVEVQDLSATQLATATASIEAAGTATGNAVEPVVAQTVTLGTGLQGRANRGRVYLYGRPEAALTSERDAFASSGFATVNTVMAGLLSAIATASPTEYAACVYHRSSDTVTVITTVRARGPLAVQRRRRDERPQF